MPEHELTPVLAPVAAEVGRVGPRRRVHARGPQPPRSRQWLVLALALATVAAAGAAASVLLVTRSSGEQSQGARGSRSAPTVAAPAVGKAVSSVGVVTVVAPAPKPRAESKTKRAAQVGTTKTTTTRKHPARRQTRSQPASTVAKLAPPVAAPPPSVSSAPKNAGPVALGGYASGETHVLVSADARTLTGFVIVARCAPKKALPPVAVRRDGSFRFAGVVARNPRTTATLTGRFVDAATARLSVRFTARGCNSGLVRMTLRLS